MTLLEHCQKLKELELRDEIDAEKNDTLGNLFNKINEDRKKQNASN